VKRPSEQLRDRSAVVRLEFSGRFSLSGAEGVESVESRLSTWKLERRQLGQEFLPPLIYVLIDEALRQYLERYADTFPSRASLLT
jgi:hypothetical protein